MCLATSSDLWLELQDVSKRIFSMKLQSSGQPKNDAQTLFFPTLHDPSPFPGNFCNCNSGGICTASQFQVQFPVLYLQSYTQREAMPTQKSAQKCCCNLLRLLARKITKDIHSCKPASLNHPIRLLLLRSCSLLIAWIFWIFFISIIYIYNVSLSLPLVSFSQGVYNFCLNLSLMW